MPLMYQLILTSIRIFNIYFVTLIIFLNINNFYISFLFDRKLSKPVSHLYSKLLQYKIILLRICIECISY